VENLETLSSIIVFILIVGDYTMPYQGKSEGGSLRLEAMASVGSS
jgi:hypothetical protein